ncbi:MAG: class I SAM-dependent methyltransferase [Vicinamibacteria bacterium]
MSRRTATGLACRSLAPFWMAFLFPIVLTGQEGRVVDPSINDRFKTPGVEAVVESLERDDRPVYKYRHAIVAALGLQAGDDVTDVGAGSGFMARLIAREVGPESQVYAVDIAQATIDYIEDAAREEGISNIKGILGGERTTHLPPDSLDLVLICDTYHHFEYPGDIMASIAAALRSGGRLVVIDYERIRGVTAESRYAHLRGGKGTFSDEIKDAGFDLEKELPLIPESYYLEFRKRAQ